VIQDLTSSVDELIRQNKALKQQIARLQSHASGATSVASRELLALQRRLSRTLAGRASRSSGASRTRRQISDPAVLQARRAALAKAREALAAKRASQRSRS
jgi:3-phenylpropionate/cinnamic acid dioxygenase small subunit